MNVYCIVSNDFVTLKDMKGIEAKTISGYEESMKKYDTATGTHFFETYQSISEDNLLLRHQYIKYYTLYTSGGCFIDSPMLDYDIIKQLYGYCTSRDIQLLQCKDLTIATTTHLAELDNILRDIKPYVTINHEDEHCTKIVLTALHAVDYHSIIDKELSLIKRLNTMSNELDKIATNMALYRALYRASSEKERNEDHYTRNQISNVIVPGLMFLVGVKLGEMFCNFFFRNS